MSGYAHTYHERDADGRPLLCDGCPACEDHAAKRGLGLDAKRFAAAWRLMIEVEYGEGGAYRSKAEKQLGAALYETSLVLQRHFALDPRRLVVVPADV